MFNEQRQTQRKVFKTKAMIAAAGAAPILGRTVDISSNGMCMSMPNPVNTGAQVQLRFDLMVDGKTHAIQASAKATYCILSGSEFKVGLQFVSLDAATLVALAKFLK